MKVAIFIEGIILPDFDGGTSREYNLAKYLNLNGIETYVINCNRGWNDIQLLKKELFSILLVPPKKFYNVKMIEKILKKFKIDAIQMEYPEIVLTHGIKLKQRLKIPLVYDAHHAIYVLQERLKRDRLTINLTKFEELVVGNYSDLFFCVSKIDKKRFIKLGIDKNKLKLVPNGVDINSIQFHGPNFNTNTVMFLGHNYYEPNEIAVKLIAEKIYPSVKQKIKNIRFLIVGECPKSLKRKYQKKDFIFTGPIEDLNTIYKNTSICICPLISGSGTRVKIFNYFAAGKPVISTSLGAEGIDVINGKHIILEDDIFKFSDHIVHLLNNRKKSIKLAKNGREYVIKCGWDKIGKKLARHYKNLLPKLN